MQRFPAAAFLCALMLSAPAGRAAINNSTIQFDYTYDTSGFFSGTNEWRRALLNDAAEVFENRLPLGNFGAIIPSGGNTWSLTIQRLGNSGAPIVTIQNPVIDVDTITIYVGARNVASSTLASSYFRYTYSGDASWTGMFQARDSTTNFDSFGGSIWFNSNTSFAPWYFDPDPLTLEDFPGQYDFYSVAQHEIEHLLGFNDQTHAFAAQVSGTTFTGANAEAIYGGPVPLVSGSDHWSQGVTDNGAEMLMQPVFYYDQRKTATDLDFAALADIGYHISSVPEPAAAVLLVVAFGALAARRPRREKL